MPPALRAPQKMLAGQPTYGATAIKAHLARLITAYGAEGGTVALGDLGACTVWRYLLDEGEQQQHNKLLGEVVAKVSRPTMARREQAGSW